MVRRRRTGNRNFPKRATLWLPFDTTIALITAGTNVESGDLLGAYFSQTGEEVPVGTTIGPIRGHVVLRPTVASAFSSAYGVEAALQLNKEGGRAVVAKPGVDIIDAMWYGQISVNVGGTEISSGVFNQAPVDQVFETKAMRKITAVGQELVMTAVSDDNTDYTLRAFGVLMLKLA